MPLRLTLEQERVVRTAEAGHNLLVSGQAGTGKSFVVNTIIGSLRSLNRKVIVVCSSGIACSVYDEDSVRSRTVHSQYALQTADMPSKMVVERATSTVHCMQEVLKADTIVWDEAGMSSKRTFELVNAIHHELDPDISHSDSSDSGSVSEEMSTSKPFGGKQIILIGEFLQLRPVPNMFDDGQMLYESDLFRRTISHRFELKKLMRQQSANSHFTESLCQLRLGKCTEECADFLRSLSRPLAEIHDPVHIYFTKLAVQMHNLDTLFRLAAKALVFECTDQGNVAGISCPADEKLLLKPNVKVMVVYNISDKIRNGSTGVFLGMTEDGLMEVEVGDGEKVKLKKETWSKRDRCGRIVGSRTQFPVVLFYASTCHKTQGLTLESAVVHCSKEFVPGLIYVAASRVRNEDTLQLLHFKPSHLLKQPQEAVTVCDHNTDELADHSCCCSLQLPGSYFKPGDVGEILEGDADAPESLAMEKYPEGLVSSFFEQDSDSVIVDLETVFLLLEDKETELIEPPGSATTEELLRNLLIPDTSDDPFAIRNNDSIYTVLNSHIGDFGMFVAIQWSKIFDLFCDHLTENPNDIYISRKDLTKSTGKLYMRIIESVDLKREARALFKVQTLSDANHSIVSDVCMSLFEMFVHRVADTIEREHETQEVVLDVEQMPIEGKAKIRHVGGWAIKKELEQARKYVRRNMFSMNSDTRQNVHAAHARCELLNEHAIVQHAWLEENTEFPGTLQVTEDRQYRKRGLLHVSDAVFKFFVSLESLRVAHLNVQRLRGTNKSDIVDDTLAAALGNQELQTAWSSIFEEAESDKKVLVDEMFKGVITRYMRMGAGQFLKDFRRAFHLKKSAEHRKRVLQRQQVAAERKDAVEFSKIIEDRSPGKRVSHCQLVGYFNKHGLSGLMRVYVKDQLLKLCMAYGVRGATPSQKKVQLGSLLVGALTSSDVNYMPCHMSLNPALQSSTEATPGHVRLRIRRA